MSDQGWGNGGPGNPPPENGYPPPPGTYPPPPGGPAAGYPPPPGGPAAGYPPPPGGLAARYLPQGGGYGGSGFIPPGGSATAMASDPNYPVTAGIDAPLTIARWRIIGNYVLAIPHLIYLYILGIAGFFVLIVAWFAALITGSVPVGMAGFLAGLHRYQWRVITYVLFLREPYPSFTLPTGYGEPGGDVAWFNIVPPQKLSRLAVFFRGFLIIPQYLLGIVLAIGLYVAWIVAFFAELFTGRWPEGLRSFVLRVEFWALRVSAWYSLLADPYPPFSIG
jgi:hypothetical protein